VRQGSEAVVCAAAAERGDGVTLADVQRLAAEAEQAYRENVAAVVRAKDVIRKMERDICETVAMIAKLTGEDDDA
jgi:hypothetical protein